jgi:AcrR family transcriptional regulator
MTQKTFFTKEAIVEAAFTLTREEGWPAVTARSIARKLGSSTMPIYSSMKSMEEIAAEVRERAEALLLEFQGRNYGGEGSLGMAVGYVTFARDERNLFRFLYIDRPLRAAPAPGAASGQVTTAEQFMSGARPVMLADQVPTAMSDPRILKSWIFTHGLASLVSGGVLDLPDEKIRTLLMESGAAFFGEKPVSGKEE